MAAPLEEVRRQQGAFNRGDIMRHFVRYATVLLTSASVTAYITPAAAQTSVAQDEAAPGARPSTQSAVSPAPAGDIIVTGSRVIQNGNNSPTPVTVVGKDQLLDITPSSVGAALQNLPVFQGSVGQGTGTGGGQGGPNGAATAVNIRNLGVYRSLVLFDGNRIQPSSNTGLVTIDMIPQMLLQRVDVVTGGVSAVYGSDAISGVVNFVTDNHFNGIKLKAQSGISQRGDDPVHELGAAFGTKLFGGRGHIEGSFEYYDDAGILDMSNRQVGKLWQIEGAGTADNPYQLYSNVRNAGTAFGGLISCGKTVGGVNDCPLNGRTFSSDGVLSSFQHGEATGTPGFEVGGDGGYFFNSSLKGGLLARRAFGRFDFDVSNDVHFFVEGLGAWNRNRYNDSSLSFTNIVLSSNNAFLSDEYRNQLPADSTFKMNEISQQLGPHTKDFNVNSGWFNAGLNGSLGNFKWELTGTHGYSKQEWTVYRNINFQHLYAALDAVTDPSTNKIVCEINANASSSDDDPNCAPLDVFGPTAASQDALNYIADVTRASAVTKLDEAGASITGNVFDTWAGPVGVALSGNWRRTSFYATSGMSPDELADCTGIRYNSCSRLHQVTFADVPSVHQTVKEAAIEADIPLLENSAIARSFTVNLAARYADYNSFGGATTWKVGVDWHITDELRVRGTRSRDFRAPNLNDLYAAATIGRSNVVDQLTGNALIGVPNIQGGNPDLKPEIGNTLTAGFVYEPHWLPGSSLAIDAYDIRITDAISSLSGTNVTVQQLCNDSGGTSTLCSLIVRPHGYDDTSADNNATEFYTVPINASSIRTKGIDGEFNYRTALGNHPFSVRALLTWQPKLSQKTPSLADVDVAGVAFSSIAGLGATPKWRATAIVTYSPTDTVQLTVSERWRSSLKWNADDSLIYNEPRIPSFGWTNLNLSFTPKSTLGDFQFYLNVQNLFDQTPPIAINSSADAGRYGAYISSDDFVGRYFTAGVQVKF
jgi:outer membrane receptor protein involved in Fe transport